jgi:hypothetical protein
MKEGRNRTGRRSCWIYRSVDENDNQPKEEEIVRWVRRSIVSTIDGTAGEEEGDNRSNRSQLLTNNQLNGAGEKGGYLF